MSSQFLIWLFGSNYFTREFHCVCALKNEYHTLKNNRHMQKMQTYEGT